MSFTFTPTADATKINPYTATRKGSFFQPKLSINKPGDEYEQEADAVADRVMRMSDGIAPRFFSSVSHIQRKCAHCEDEEKKGNIQRKESTVFIQRDGPNPPAAASSPVTRPTPSVPPVVPAATPVLSPAVLPVPTAAPAAPVTGPAPSATPEPGRNGSASDAIGAVAALPQVSRLIDQQKQRLLQALSAAWADSSLFGKFFAIAAALGLGSGLAMAIYASRDNPATLDFFVSPLSGTVLQIPAISALPSWTNAVGLEVNFDRLDPNAPARNQMVGVHFDVGRFLPSSLGFGPVDSFTPIGAPPGINRKENDEEPSSTTDEAQANAESYIHSLPGKGQSLPPTERSFFEQMIGHDFSRVKIHTDSQAQASAKSINALAYTTGSDIVFGPGQYQPETSEGKRLIAHELTHVVQQNNNLQKKSIQRQEGKDPSTLSDDDLKTEYNSVKDFVDRLGPTNDSPEQDSYFSQLHALEAELRKRCMKDKPTQPESVSDQLIGRITGKFEKVDGDPGEGMVPTPYVASEGQCTIGYGHVIFPKSLCEIKTEEPAPVTEPSPEDPKKAKAKPKPKKTCVCQPPFNYISKEQAANFLKSDIRNQVKEVHSKIKVDLNQAEFDAMADLALHVGSLPADFVSFVHQNWCTDKNAVHERYLKTAITMKDPNTKKMVVMSNFVERRKKRGW